MIYQEELSQLTPAEGFDLLMHPPQVTERFTSLEADEVPSFLDEVAILVATDRPRGYTWLVDALRRKTLPEASIPAAILGTIRHNTDHSLLDIYLDALESANSEIVMWGLIAVARLRHPLDNADIERFLRHESEYVIGWTLAYLVEVYAASALDQVAPYLKHPHRMVRMILIDALEDNSIHAALPLLQAHLATETDEDLQEVTRAALSTLEGTK